MQPRLKPGCTYTFVLVSGRVVEIVFHGGAPGGALRLSVDGVRGTYNALDLALGEPYVSCTEKC